MEDAEADNDAAAAELGENAATQLGDAAAAELGENAALQLGDEAAATIGGDATAEGDEGIDPPDDSLFAALRHTDPGAFAAFRKIRPPSGSRSQSNVCSRRSTRGSNRGTSEGSHSSRGSRGCSRGSRRSRARGRTGVMSSTWPCRGGSAKVPWVSKAANLFRSASPVGDEVAAETSDFKSGDVNSTDAEDVGGVSEEALQRHSPAAESEDEKTEAKAEEQLDSDAEGADEMVAEAEDQLDGDTQWKDQTLADAEEQFDGDTQGNDQTVADAERQLGSNTKEVAAEVVVSATPQDVNITDGEAGAAATEEQILSQNLVTESNEAKAGVEAVQPGSDAKGPAPEGRKRSRIAFAADAFRSSIIKPKESSDEKHAHNRRLGIRMSECIINRIREDLAVPRRIPKRPRLCGRCKPLEITKTANWWPDKKLHRDLKESFDRVSLISQGTIKPNRQDHFVMDLDTVRMPELPKQSRLSQKPHPKFKAMPACDIFRLEVSLMQHKVKEPAMKTEIENMGADGDHTFKELHHELDLSSLRIIVQTKPADRRFDDSLRLFKFLRKLIYFKDLKPNLLATIGLWLQACRYEAGEVMYSRGDAFSGVYIVTRGRVNLTQLPVAPKEEDKKPAKRRLYRQRSTVNERVPSVELSSQEVAAIEELQPTNKVFGVAALLKDIVWPEERLHQGTAVVQEPSEAFYIPADKLLHILEEESLRERTKALQDMLPITRRMSWDDLQQPSKVERRGLRPPIQRLFDVKEYPKNFMLYQYGEVLSPSEACIYIVLAGTVQLNGRLKVQDTLGVGAVLGEEALRTDPYYTSAVISSDKARVMWIRVDEYVTQFMGGKFKASSSKAAQQATMQSPGARAGLLWKNSIWALKAISFDKSGNGDEEPNEEENFQEDMRFGGSDFVRALKQVRGQVLKKDKELWDHFVAKDEKKPANSEEITWPSSVMPITLPNRVAPFDSLDVLTTSRERLQALDKSLEEGFSPRRRQHVRNPEAGSSETSPSSTARENRQRFVTEDEVAKSTMVTASRMLMNGYSSSASGKSRSELGGSSEVLDSSASLNWPPVPVPKSVTFRPSPSVRSISNSASTAGTSSASAWVRPNMSAPEDVIESCQEARPPLPAMPPGRTYHAQSRRPPGSPRSGRAAEDPTGIARNELRPGALSTAAQSILTSPRVEHFLGASEQMTHW